MAFPAATIDATGASAPDYASLLGWFQDQYRGIYGADIDLDADTQDGQFLGILSLALSDSNDAVIAAYNSVRPSGATGVALAAIVKLNGIRTKVATNSTVIVSLVGTAGTPIENALVGDSLSLGTQWAIAGPISIPDSGTIDVEAISTTAGAVTAAPATITNIITPIPGWQSVTNALPAVAGAPVESDAALRRRQTASTSLPAQTIVESIEGAIGNLLGVQRYRVFQNDTTIPTADGIPANSMVAVVEGGDPIAITSTIAALKPPAIPTYGTLSEVVVDSRGVPNLISYYPVTDVDIYVAVLLTTLTGYKAIVATLIQQSLIQLISNLNVGDDSLLGRLWAPADLKGDEATEATGYSQTLLDQYSSTYKIAVPFGLAQAKTGMTANAAFAGGTVIVTVADITPYTIGKTIYITLNDGSLWQTVITGITVIGNQITFAPAVPAAGSILNGAIVYVVDDLILKFNEAARALVVGNVVVKVS